MNKYVAAGLLAEAERGDRIAVVVGMQMQIREALGEFEAIIGEQNDPTAHVRKANGAERIDTTYGGRIIFTTPRSNRLRGYSLDTVFIDNDAHYVLTKDPTSMYEAVQRFREDVAAALNGRSGTVVYS